MDISTGLHTCTQSANHATSLNLTDFIAFEDGPTGSPDLNPLDYRLQDEEQEPCSKPHRNIESLKRDLAAGVALTPMATVREAIDEQPYRLRKYAKAKRGQFE